MLQFSFFFLLLFSKMVSKCVADGLLQPQSLIGKGSSDLMWTSGTQNLRPLQYG